MPLSPNEFDKELEGLGDEDEFKKENTIAAYHGDSIEAYDEEEHGSTFKTIEDFAVQVNRWGSPHVSLHIEDANEEFEQYDITNEGEGWEVNWFPPDKVHAKILKTYENILNAFI